MITFTITPEMAALRVFSLDLRTNENGALVFYLVHIENEPQKDGSVLHMHGEGVNGTAKKPLFKGKIADCHFCNPKP
jgi:hypothetical protein